MPKPGGPLDHDDRPVPPSAGRIAGRYWLAVPATPAVATCPSAASSSRVSCGWPSSCWPSPTGRRGAPARRRSPTGARVSTRCTPSRLDDDRRVRLLAGVPAARSRRSSTCRGSPSSASGRRSCWLAVRFLTGPRLFAVGVLLAAAELAGGNISLLLAVAIVVGFRWPAAWALILLTKVSPGIGLLWFAVRREWRNLAIALGATAAVVAVSAVIMPGAWLEWLERPDASRRSRRRPGPRCRSRSSSACRSRRRRRLGRPDRSALDGPGRLHAGAAGPVVRRPDDAPRGHRPARPAGPRATPSASAPSGDDGRLGRLSGRRPVRARDRRSSTRSVASAVAPAVVRGRRCRA